MELLRIEHPNAGEKYNGAQFSSVGEFVVAWRPGEITIFTAPTWEEINRETMTPGERSRPSR